MHRRIIASGIIFGGLAVALGAFGAHGLERLTSDGNILQGFRTGVQYQMYHALALLASGILFQNFNVKWIRWAATLFITGILLFSGSLYLLTFLKIQGSDAVSWVGPVTPVGGLLLIAGWICLLIGVTKKKLL